MAGILSKNVKLSYATTSSGSYTEIANIQEFPSMGGSVDKVETTCLSNSVRTYIKGIKDFGDLQFKLLYDNDDATSNYRVLRGLEEAGGVVYWKVEFPDAPTAGTGTHNGTIFAFSGEPSVSVDGAGVNAALTFTLTIALNSDVEVTNPA